MKKKIITIVGARPQFIKAAPLSVELRKFFIEILVHTGQHYDGNMSDIFFQELTIPRPDYNLNVGSGHHGRQTALILSGVEEIILKEQPDLVMVYGDTNSTLAGTLAASKLLIPVAHVEAGLRSFNKGMPEEQNRVVTDHLSKLLFCPTETAVANLMAENIHHGVYMTGDIMYDSVLKNLSIAETKYSLSELIISLAPGLSPNGYNLLTIHRAENTANPRHFREILTSVNNLPHPTLMPVHPRVSGMINPEQYPNIWFVAPVGYLEMLLLTKNAARVLTDSGGLQKEAWMMNTRCITLRSNTEWVETLANNCNILVPDLSQLEQAYDQNCDWSEKAGVFGDGKSAVHITQAILKFLSGDEIP